MKVSFSNKISGKGLIAVCANSPGKINIKKKSYKDAPLFIFKEKSAREFGSLAVTEAKKLKLSSIEFIDSKFDKDQILEGAILANYSFDKFLSKKNSKVQSITFIGKGKVKRRDLTGVFLARDLGNLPANHCTPRTLVDISREIAKEKKLKLTIYTKRELEKLGAGALLAVAQGSEQEPYLIKLEYKTNSKKNIALIGKGITYDTGGYSLKPAGSMDGMKHDMSGAAVVLGVMKSLGKPNVNVTAYIPTCENMISGKATRVGDVVKSLSGKTIEILNTDAEGRLILADAITLAKRDKVTEIIDLATLTGGALVALGTTCACLLSNNDEITEKLLESSKKTEEMLWRLPLLSVHKKDLKSKIADIKNIPGHRWAQTIIAALFLEEFVEKTPWVHLDIAGVADKEGESTGFGVRTILEYLSTEQ